jgi:hypothetical protein
MTFVLMALAAYRITRFFTLDDLPVLAAPRRRATSVISERFGEDWSDGIVCAWCIGVWVSIGIVAVTAQLTNVPLPVLQALAVSTVVGLIATIDN